MARRRDDVVIEIRNEPRVVLLDVIVGGKSAGFMELAKKRKLFSVSYAEVTQPGKGLGTWLYTAAAQFACKHGAQLTSDDKRSRFSEGFWKKQARKGRATCDASQRGTRLADDLSYKGSWRCKRYILNGCPPPKSLAGVRVAK